MLAIGPIDGLEFQVGEDFAQKKVRTMMNIKQIGVAPEPSQARLGRPFPLQHRTGIDVASDQSAGFRSSNRFGHRARRCQHSVVVVRPEGVGGNSTAKIIGPLKRRRSRRRIRIGQADYGAQPRIKLTRIETPIGIARQIMHLAGSAIVQPLMKKRFAIFQPAQPRKTGQNESRLPCRRCDMILENIGQEFIIAADATLKDRSLTILFTDR